MSIASKLLAGIISALVVSLGVAFAAGSSDDSRPQQVTTSEISGPCDEAEHANDPRCAGVQAPRRAGAPAAGAGVDISGPCDEAEHANDPRCAGVQAPRRAVAPAAGAGVDVSGPCDEAEHV